MIHGLDKHIYLYRPSILAYLSVLMAVHSASTHTESTRQQPRAQAMEVRG